MTNDTLVNNVRCFGIELLDSNIHYSLGRWFFLDRKTYLPVSTINRMKGADIIIGNQKIVLNQYTKVDFSDIKDTSNFEYLLSDKSLPPGIEIKDHVPMATPIKKGSIAPSWKFPEIASGKLISSDSLLGKILIIDFTSTWCFHCTEGSAIIKELYQNYGSQPNLRFVNVFCSSLDNRDKIQKFVKNRNIEGITVYEANSIEKPYGIMGYPNFCIIDTKGRISLFYPGYAPNLKETLSKGIDKCLSEEK